VLLADFINEEIWAITPTDEVPWTGAELAVPNAGSVVIMRKNSDGETIILALGSTGYKMKKTADPPAIRKNGVCEVGESCKTDPEDCPGQLTGPKTEKWCCTDGQCDNSLLCGNVDCDASAVVPGFGNNICDDGETCITCSQDCYGHTSAGKEGLQFCSEGAADFEVTCTGVDCTTDICLRKKTGNKNKFLEIPMG
jgi:hypothetical protein